ncbi:hypothetical protein [Cohnella boryungensis]|jgi:hypothetical protein|uniref:YozE SAM-like domain-containing protein n=1 Tax=Cohnella boryungensis TaxID=768479 RepID=A0ABV8SB73_9BACL
MSQPVHEVIIDLLISYSTKEERPSATEILSVENALPYVEDHLEKSVYDSYVDWVNRCKQRHDGHF